MPCQYAQTAQQPEDLARMFVERAQAKDAEGLTELYEPDAVLAYPPGQQTVGRDAIRAVMEQLWRPRSSSQPEEPLPTVRFGDLALTSTRPADGTGGRVQVARRQAGRVMVADHRPARAARASGRGRPPCPRLAGRGRALAHPGGGDGRAVPGRPVHHGGQRGAADDRPRPARQRHRPGVDRRRVRAGLRQPAGGRRDGRGPPRPQGDVPARRGPVRAGLAGRRPRAHAPGCCWPPGCCRASARPC